MRLATVLFAAIATPGSLSTTARAQQSRGSDSSAVAQTLRQFHEALARGDSAAALALLADDAIVLEAGGTESRAEYRSQHLPADIRFAQAVPSTAGPVRVVLAGDAAWATSTSESKGSFEGRAINSTGVELAVLTRSGASWKIRALHWSSRRRATP